MTYHSIRNEGCQAVWVTEADDGNGSVLTAIFIGKNARQRAEEYAAWKNGNAEPEGHPEHPEQPKAA